MGDHYRRRLKNLIEEYNRPFPGPYYFGRFFSHKHITEAKVADLGSGPVCTLGSLWSSVKITIHASDIQEPEYTKAVNALGCKLLVPIEYQDMENLTYPDNSFDLVHCVNALDHTPNIEKALSEMRRICKPNGFIYLRHAHNQKSAHHGNGHYWDAKVTGFTDGQKLVPLTGFSTVDDGYYIVSILRK
jgi:ubiquinone/menaquinone biosynthesis C-methylase UbiE